MSEEILRLLVGFLALGFVFGVLERVFSSVRGQALLRRGYWTDVGYWFLTPPVTTFATDMVVSGTLAALLLLDAESVSGAAPEGFVLMAEQPIWLQVAVGLVLGDLVNYWQHRLFHCGLLWRFHAVHHSSREVDWLSAVRLHPVNNVVARTLQALFLTLIGFDPDVVAVCIPLLFLYALMLHANVNWNFGVLKYFLVSPVYHRWHHTKEGEGLGKNLASMFVFWDVIFGTHFLPENRQPAQFGTDEPIRDGFVAQMVYPFQRRHA